MTPTPERLAQLLEDAPVGAVACLTLHHDAARREAARTVARFLCEGLERCEAGEGQFALPL